MMFLHDAPSARLGSHPHAYDPLRTASPLHPARFVVAALLHGASRLLDRLAVSLVNEPTGLARNAEIEFHAESGAPEGALYVDGRLVGHVLGVKRL